MIAGPGTGKTWSSCQLMYHLSKASVVLFLLLSHGFLTCWLVGNRLIPHSAQLQDQHQSQLCHRQACAQNTDSTGIVKMPALIFAQKLAGDPVALRGTAQRFMYFWVGFGDVRAMSLQAWCAKMELAMPNTQVFHWQWLDKKMPKTILINLQSRCLFLHRGSKCYPGQTVVAKCLQGRAAVVACQPLTVNSQVIPVNWAVKLDLPQVWDGICWYFGSCLAAAKCGGHLAVSSGSSWIEAFCE